MSVHVLLNLLNKLRSTNVRFYLSYTVHKMKGILGHKKV